MMRRIHGGSAGSWRVFGRKGGASRPEASRCRGRARSASAALAALVALLVASFALSSAAAEVPAAAESRASSEKSALPGTWHATVFFSNGETYRIIHYWSAGTSMRAETLISGHPITTIVRGDRYVAFDRLTGEGIDVERSPAAIAEDHGRLRPFGIELDELKKGGGERVEETTMSGVPVEVWRLTDDSSRRTVWVSQKAPHVPIRAETFVRGSSQTLVFDYSSWRFDLELPAAFFGLPSDAQIDRYGHAEFVAKSAQEPIGRAPILYPDLLYGGSP
jgi:outer membrane lipoprotein-sorting protein